MVKLIPSSVDEALEFLASHDAYIVAGGTDAMVLKRNAAGLLPKFDKDVLFISNLKELKRIYQDHDGIHIGAAVTLDEVYNSDIAPKLLKECIGEVASINIRHFATLVGNIANASPAGDTIVVDYLLDAKLKIESTKGDRLVNAEDIVLGVRKIDLKPGELITEIIFPKVHFNGRMWYKVGSRKADSISKVSVAGVYCHDKDKITRFALAFGSVAMTVKRSHEIEKEIEGLSAKKLEKRCEEFVEKYAKIISPIDDQRSNKEYRLLVAKNITRKFIKDVVEASK